MIKTECVTPTAVTTVYPKEVCASLWLPTVPIKSNHAKSSDWSGNIAAFALVKDCVITAGLRPTLVSHSLGKYHIPVTSD